MQRLLVDHLARNLGLVTTTRAIELGVSHRQLVGLVERGELERVHQGVYRSRAWPIDDRQRLVAGVLAAGDRAVVSHRSALVVHGAPNLSSRLAEVTVRSSSRPRHPGIVVHRSRHLGPADVTRVDGLWVTTIERTLLDSCAVLPASLVMRIAEHFLSSRRTTIDALHAITHRLSRLPGAAALARGLSERDLGTAVPDSPAEHRLGVLVAKRGLPAEHHVVVTTVDGTTYELDWAYPRVGVALEMDGYGIHLRSMRAFDDDRFRRNDIENEGWQVLNFTERQVRRHPGRVLTQIHRAIARREVHRQR